MKRRQFLRKTGAGAAGIGASAPFVTSGMAQNSPNDTIRLGIMGVRNRGWAHMRHFSAIRKVKVTTICDIDERILAQRQDDCQKEFGKKLKTYTDIREMLDDKEIDAITVAAPNHWHALAGIWACQAGKDAYVEKPLSHTVWEGRQLVKAMKKYNRIVQTGSQRRADPTMIEAKNFIQSGELGDIYMAKAVVYRRRGSIGHGKVDPIPDGVHYDLFRGPAPMIPFSENRFHYHWHWFWDTGNGEIGNNGPHPADLFRWIMKRDDHPVQIQSMGGIYIHDTEQETPNTQLAVMKYNDGLELQVEVRNLFSNLDGDVREGLIFYGSKGWIQFNLGLTWTSFLGRDNEPGPSMTKEQADDKHNMHYQYGRGWEPHFQNFIDCMRSRKAEDLIADAEQGHYAASICHLANIAYRTGRTLQFDSDKEQFVGDREANKYLRRKDRKPYVVPKNV